MTNNQSCPCNRSISYKECCEVFHKMVELPQTAEQLMRSRYSAYALKLVDYLVSTTHKDKLKSSYRRNLMTTIHDIDWTDLEVIKTTAGGLKDKSGKVRFRASYIENGSEGMMEEYSRFKRVAGRWYYYDGKG